MLNATGTLPEDGIGISVFGLTDTVIEGAGVPDNRQHLIQTKINCSQHTLQENNGNTEHIYSRRSGGHRPPHQRPRFETIDFITAPYRWERSMTNCYTHSEAGIDTDHFPVIAEVGIVSKANTQKT